MPIPSNSLQRVAAGSAGAIQESIETHGDLVWSLVRRYGRTVEEAEQTVEEVFAVLWDNACWCPDGPDHELAFVATCVRRQLLGVPFSHESPVLDTRVGTVERELLAMTGERQSVLRQCVSEGRSPCYVATCLDLPQAIVRDHLRSGLRAIRARLADSSPAVAPDAAA